MGPIDDSLGMDWTKASYVGDGVYIMDATDRQGVLSVAIRTDREKYSSSAVIVLEKDIFESLVRQGRAEIAYQHNLRALQREQEGA